MCISARKGVVPPRSVEVLAMMINGLSFLFFDYEDE